MGKRSRLLRGLAAAALAVLAAGCASVPEPQGDQSSGAGPVRDFTLSGRLAVRDADRSDLMGVEWQHRGDHDRIALSTPLGSQVMLLEEQPGHVQLTLPDRPPVEAIDDQELTRKLLGYTLPVQGLAEWVVGRVPAGHDRQVRGAGGTRVDSFIQGDWTGTLQHWRQVGEDALPGLISVRRDALQIRLVVDRWVVSRGQP